MKIMSLSYCVKEMKKGEHLGNLVYGIRHKAQNKWYVGRTNNLKKRMVAHVHLSYKPNHTPSYIQRSIAKHGVDAFEVHILERDDSKEGFWIREKNAFEKGFNLVLEGLEGKPNIVSEATRKKMAIASRKENRVALLALARVKSKRTKGLRWVKKGDKEMFVPKATLEKHLEEGWVEGRLFRHSKAKGYVWIYKDGVGRRVSPKKLGALLKEGWARQGPTTAYCWLNLDGRRTRVPSNEIAVYLEKGWSKGRTQSKIKKDEV